MLLRKLLESLEQINEATAGIGAFGGKRYTWPDLGVKWEDVDYDQHVVDSDDFMWIKYQNTGGNSFLFIEFDASGWVRSAGEKPVKYVISFTGVPKANGTIKDPSRLEMLKVVKKAEKLAGDSIKNLKKKLPSFSGWEKSYYNEWLTYRKYLSSMYYVEVEFLDVDEAILNNESSDVIIRFWSDDGMPGSDAS